MNLYISTSLKSELYSDGGELVDQLSRLGVEGVELDYRIHPETVPSIKSALRQHDLKVSSVHNFFPTPDIRPRRPGSGDFFNMAALDAEERREAVKWTTRTIEWASEFGAQAVVIHCGLVKMDSNVDVMKTAYKEGTLDTESMQLLIDRKLNELASKKPPHLDALRFVLDKLIRISERENVTLALENRNHYHELPGPDDFGLLFSEFSGAPLGYWHDTGHDHVMTALHFSSEGKMLQQYGKHLVGFHIHDARGMEDHLPPASGKIDFTQVKSHLKAPVIGVFELKSGTPDPAVKEGITWFRRYLAQADIP